MAEYEVACIRRDGSDVDRRIDALGGPGWKTAHIDDVIRWIEIGGHHFYVQLGQSRVYLEVKINPVHNRKYLRTTPDGRYDNNLYALQECPPLRL